MVRSYTHASHCKTSEMYLRFKTAFESRLLLDTTLKSLGFIQLQTDKCIYKARKSFHGLPERLILVVYVNDIFCLGISSHISSWFHQLISNHCHYHFQSLST